jgi:hypothetical protein
MRMVTRCLFTRSKLMRVAAVISAAAVICGLCLVGTEQGASAQPRPGIAISGHRAESRSLAITKECFYSVPDCTSSDANVTFTITSIGDTSSCTFTTKTAWGDDKSTTQTYPGGADGSVIATFKHTYADDAATYQLVVTNPQTTGGCGNFGTADLQFTLTPPGCAVSGTTCPACPKPPSARARPGAVPSPSDIWSGYGQAGSPKGRFTGVVSEWKVPTVDTKISGLQAVSDWVGVDGDGNNDKLVQAGTASRNNGGTASYYAWVETLPANEVRIDLTVHPGDSMIVYVVQAGKTTWDFMILDGTTGKRYDCHVDYDTPGQDAEAIHERPTIGGKPATLATTGNVSFGLTEVATGGPGKQHWSPIGSAFADDTLERIFMHSSGGGPIIAAPSPLKDDACFTVAKGDKAPPAPPPCT